MTHSQRKHLPTQTPRPSSVAAVSMFTKPARRAMRPAGLLLAALLLITGAGAARAQTLTTTSATDGITAPGTQAGSPAGSYALTDLDSISPYSGSLSFHLPLLRVGGRGSAAYTITLPVERKWRIEHTVSDPNLYCERCDLLEVTHSYRPTDQPWGIVPGYGAGVMQGRHAGSQPIIQGQPNQKFYSLTLTRLTFTAADGTEYELRDELHKGKPLSLGEGGYRGNVFVTADGSSATFIADAPISDKKEVGDYQPFYPSGYLLLKDGTRYRISTGHVESIRDRQGNSITFGWSGNERVITDSLGREVRIAYADLPSVPYDEIKFKNVGGIERRIRVHYASLSDRLRTGYSPTAFGALFPVGYIDNTPYDPPVVASVELPSEPSNVRSYNFRYNNYGELARVELPTGGAFEYDFQSDAGVIELGSWVNEPFGQMHEYEIYRRALRKRVYNTGGALESRTEFSGGCTDYFNTEVMVKQFAPDDSITPRASSKHYYYGCALPWMTLYEKPTEYAQWSDGREYKTEVLNPATGAVLRRTEQEWRQREPVSWWGTSFGRYPTNDPRVVETKTTIEPAGANLVAKTSAINPDDPNAVGFDQYNNPTDVWEYDFGTGQAGALVRHTHTDYVTASAYTSHTGAHLRGLPSAQKVYGFIGGSETLVAQSETLYDQPAYVAPNYDQTPTGWDATVPSTRGNATTGRTWVDTSNTWLETHATFDQLGNVVSATDARGNTSSVTYADAFSDSIARNTYAFPTQTISAVPAPNPGPYAGRGAATALTSSTIYDFSTGLVISTKDANGQTTYLHYRDDTNVADPLGRLLRVERPDGGVTKYHYGDTAGDLYVQTSTYRGAGRTLPVQSRQNFDGLGRAVRSFLYDGSQWLTSDTQYDALGRAWRVSANPYLSAGSGSPVNPSDQWVESNFDALGRVKTVTTPDGAAVKTDYDGARVLVTDQAGKQRISRTDALGRLREVWEVRSAEPAAGTEAVTFPSRSGVPAVAAGYKTTYDYDALGNLRKVGQGGQSRYFMYDSLSRLVRTKNPEQGNFTSGGDFPALTDATAGAPGNGEWSVGYAYDANGNLSKRKDARNVVTIYAYDNINRLIGTDYSDSTPDTLLGYDTATNGRGLFYSDYVSGTTGTVNYVLAYDAAGRPTSRRTDFHNGTSWVGFYATSRTYDLTGNVTSQTYPSGHTVNYTGFDTAGRLKAVSGNLGDGMARTYADNITYDEAGRMREERFGTQTSLYHKLHYNVRGQLYDVRLSTAEWGAGGGGQWDWNRGALTLFYGGAAHGQSSSSNNGNVTQTQSYVPANATATVYNFTEQRYVYDELNRLSSATEYAGTQAGLGATAHGAQSYKYDRFGNREIKAAETYGAGFPAPQFAVNTANNRIGVPASQGGMMTYDNAGNLTVDTYSAYAAQRQYDAENRMTQEQNSQTSVFSKYTYDASGKRVRRDTGGNVTWQVYGFDGELLAEYGGGAAPFLPRKEYGYRGGELLVTATNGDEVRLSRFITNFYAGALGRLPSAAEATAWLNALGGAQGQAALLAQAQSLGQTLFSSAEYAGRSRSNSEFVTDLYWAYLQRAPDAGGLNAWVAVLGPPQSLTRAATRDAFDDSAELSSITGRLYGVEASEEGRIDNLLYHVYQGALGRGPSAAELTAGRARLGGAGAQGFNQVRAEATELAREVYTSAECEGRGRTDAEYVADLYAGLWQRAPDAAGLSSWTSEVANGGRAGALEEFLSSGEYKSLSGALYREANWLVSDHLGTPRMVADRSGSLTGIKRHDYLPFGEEIGAGVGGRTGGPGGHGYNGDNVRQKFTGYERDIETTLDYAQARYYSNQQGRFTSVDPLLESANPTVPQGWNRYTYALNNPYVFVDPRGLSPCPPDEPGCQQPTRPPNTVPRDCGGCYVNSNGLLVNADGSPYILPNEMVGGSETVTYVDVAPQQKKKGFWGSLWSGVKSAFGFGAAGVVVGGAAGGGAAGGGGVTAAAAVTSPGITRIISGQTITDPRGNILGQGNVDLQPTFDRIAKGIRDSHGNDGTTYQNRVDRTTGQVLLPVQSDPRYYTEWVVRTPGQNAVGPQRIITGKAGEVWYTPDHYKTAIPLNASAWQWEVP